MNELNDKKLKLPVLISDGMVLQQGQKTRIWGKAAENGKVSLAFLHIRCETVANSAGCFEFTIDALEYGGPYSLTIESSGETITVRDILIGEVWFCSGQSNMELPMSRVSRRYPEELSSADNPKIRQFLVQRCYDLQTPRDEYSDGKWEAVSKESIPKFYAASYFFAVSLYERLGIPVGLINCAVGGSPIQAWISKESLRAFPRYYDKILKNENNKFVEEKIKTDQKRQSDWFGEVDSADQGIKGKWYLESTDFSDWRKMNLTDDWANHEELLHNGSFWFSTDFFVSDENLSETATLQFGCLRDADFTYLNGVLIGSTGYQYPPREYKIPSNLLRKGINRIVVRVLSFRGIGGFVKGKPYFVEIGNKKISLDKIWYYIPAAEMPSLEQVVNFELEPAALYNSLVSPSLRFGIRGVIWYQGESNTDYSTDYAELFEVMVAKWRGKKESGDFPFIFMQLANYSVPFTENAGWPELREQQRKCLGIVNTAMAVSIDIGEYNDLHPLNKKEIGRRLALCALNLAYDEKNEFSGPAVKRVYRSGTEVHIEFEHCEGGLQVYGGNPVLSVSGNNSQFKNVLAEIGGTEIIIRNIGSDKPLKIRYAWQDSPKDALIYNKSGLPASPFEEIMG